MNELKWMTEIAKEFGRTHLHAFTTGIIGVVIGEIGTTAEEKVVEVVRILRDMRVVFDDEAYPWDVTDAKKDSSPQGAPKENFHLDCTIDLSRVKSLIDFPLTERGPNCKECKCFDCGELIECHVIKPSAMHHCAYFCEGRLPTKACKYFDKENGIRPAEVNLCDVCKFEILTCNAIYKDIEYRNSWGNSDVTGCKCYKAKENETCV